MATQLAARPTVRDNGVTSTWDTARYILRQGGTNIVGTSPGGIHLLYTFPNPQRTTRPGLPWQTRLPKTP